MAAVTICSDFGAQEDKVCHCFHCFPIYLPWSDGVGCCLSEFSECWVLSQIFYSFTFIRRLFSSSSLSAIRMVSSAYLRLLTFLLEILIPVCDSPSPGFHIMYLLCIQLNEQGDNIQPWRTPFPVWNQSIFPCLILTVASWPAYRFLRRQVKWFGIPISLRIFHSLLWSTPAYLTYMQSTSCKMPG